MPAIADEERRIGRRVGIMLSPDADLVAALAMLRSAKTGSGINGIIAALRGPDAQRSVRTRTTHLQPIQRPGALSIASAIFREERRIGRLIGEEWPDVPELSAEEYLAVLREVPDRAGSGGLLRALEQHPLP